MISTKILMFEIRCSMLFENAVFDLNHIIAFNDGIAEEVE